MAKDPAVLWYPDHFLGGVEYMSMEDRGKYITLLCNQFISGHIPENHMISVCGSIDSPVIKKFVKDDDGNYKRDLKNVIELTKRQEEIATYGRMMRQFWKKWKASIELQQKEKFC